MNIETRFNLGQEVWGISSAYAARQVFCQTCQRQGVVTIGDEQFTCPKCHGTSKHPKQVGMRWYISEHCTRIGKIEAEMYAQNARYEESKIKYMVEATGIGSGKVWRQDDLFASEADALAACESRNAGMIFKDDA